MKIDNPKYIGFTGYFKNLIFWCKDYYNIKSFIKLIKTNLHLTSYSIGHTKKLLKSEIFSIFSHFYVYAT